jgi:ArsR family transcriptional regulator
MNISKQIQNDPQGLADLFQVLGQSSRLQILFGIGQGEVCVCHLEALLGERQAYVSQELMLLKDVGLVDCRRSGRNIYYHLIDPALLENLRTFADQLGQPVPEIKEGPVADCPCPRCNPGSKDCLSGEQK